jgi:SAM-dependent methyltransferase
MTPSIDHAVERYAQGSYCLDFGDGAWKAAQLAKALSAVPECRSIETLADLGCGDGTVLAELHRLLIARGQPLARAIGYDVSDGFRATAAAHPELSFETCPDLARIEGRFDLVVLADVIEHVLGPTAFLRQVGRLGRFVLLHIPLDDRWSVLAGNQFNYRIGPVGHISFWNPASALTLLTEAGLLPLHCEFTPGFAAPSGRRSLLQRVALVPRQLLWLISPGIAARTIGGVSLAVVCRGRCE